LGVGIDGIGHVRVLITRKDSKTGNRHWAIGIGRGWQLP
jgi:hypothetical protein